jgi:DNA-binding SARP family transcriptional activator
MEFRILGPLEVEAEDGPLPLGSPKQRALLEVLLLNANEVVSRDRLIEEVWGEQPPATAPTALQVYVSRLRKLLEPSDGRGEHRVLVTQRPGYLLRVDGDQLDLLRFQRLLRDGRAALAAGDPERAATHLGDALALWRGEPLAELNTPPGRLERDRLGELRLTAIEERLEAELALGRHADVVEELEALVARHQLRDRLRGQLMLALYRCGRQAAALEAYRLGRQQLREELGLEPGEALQRLERAILNHDPSLELAPSAAPAEPPPRGSGSIPSGTVTFLFSDIEGSTRLLKELGAQYDHALADHQRIMRAAFSAHGGREVDTQGDSFFVAFGRAKDAVAAAVDAQRDLAAQVWPDGAPLKVRMGLHTGEPRVGGERYVGLGVHKAARIAAAGHGGQVLLSRTTRELVEDELPTGVTVRDLGERRLKDLDRPERLSQLVIEGLESDFARLNTLDEELRRKRRLMYAGSALIGVLAAAVAIPVFALGQGGLGSGANVAPNSLAVIDAHSNKVIGTAPAGVRPSAVAIGAGSVWVVNIDDKTMLRIDPQSRSLQRTIPLTATPTGVAVGFGAVWVANGIAGSVSRVDPGTDDVTMTRDVTPLAAGGSVTVGADSVWAVFSNSTLGRIDPTSGRLLATGIAGTAPTAIAYGGAAVWVANSGDNNVSRILPATATSSRSRASSGGDRGRRRSCLGGRRGRQHGLSHRSEVRFGGHDPGRSGSDGDCGRWRRSVGGELGRRHGLENRSDTATGHQRHPRRQPSRGRCHRERPRVGLDSVHYLRQTASRSRAGLTTTQPVRDETSVIALSTP